MIHKLLGIGENRATNFFFLNDVALHKKVLNKTNKNYFGLNGKEPKLKMFLLFFGLLHETKNLVSFGLFPFVSAFRTCIETTETNMTDSKHILTNK
jgi:hypothetical protein